MFENLIRVSHQDIRNSIIFVSPAECVLLFKTKKQDRKVDATQVQ